MSLHFRHRLLTKYCAALFLGEGKIYPEYAVDKSELRSWLETLVEGVRARVLGDLDSVSDVLDYHCSRSEREAAIGETLEKLLSRVITALEDTSKAQAGLPDSGGALLDPTPKDCSERGGSVGADDTVLPSADRRLDEPSFTTRRFRRSGDVWLVSFGGRSAHVAHSKGMQYILELLRYAGRSIYSFKLLCAVAGEQQEPMLGSAGEALTAEALADYRRRMEDLDQRLSEAERNCDQAQKELAEAERDKLYQQIASATGLAGRTRNANDDAEKVRKSVSNAIGRAVEAIRKHHADLAQHFDIHLKRGSFLEYVADEIGWEF